MALEFAPVFAPLAPSPYINLKPSDPFTSLARFAIRLNLPAGERQFLNDAAEAVRKEYRNSVRVKRLRCRKVSPLTEQPGETIFVLEIGHSIEFDWTWEGATAFRPPEPNSFAGDVDATDDFVSHDANDTVKRATWSGEIVEVDETNGKLFVSVSSPDHPPCTGTFFVRPFEFLAFLHDLYCQSPDHVKNRLVSRLNASCGNIHPKLTGSSTSWLAELEQLWQHSWSVLWGPPGTGKTHTLARPIAEFALNILYRLQPPDTDADHKELIKLGLVEYTEREGKPWWNVRFNQVDGPLPIFKKFPSLNQQVDAIAEQVLRWIRNDGIKPGDICVLCNDKRFRDQIRDALSPRLKEINAKVITDPGKGWDRDESTVVASTLHSFKGYDSEIVLVAGLERFIGQKEILANNLYVAMTRARSILAVYAYARQNPSQQTEHLLTTTKECLDELLTRPLVEPISNLEDFEDIAQCLDKKHRDWFAKIWQFHHKEIQQEPIEAADGEILAEPLFWFRLDGRVIACFRDGEPGTFMLHKLEDSGIDIFVIRPGQELPNQLELDFTKAILPLKDQKERCLIKPITFHTRVRSIVAVIRSGAIITVAGDGRSN